jgi:hypothetical protein
MALSRCGTAGRPLKETEAMSNALTDIGNRGLEPAPIADRTDPEHSPATPTTIPGQPDRLRTFVEPGRGEPVAPKTPPALRANFHLGPLIPAPELKETLDGNVQWQYQGSVLCEFYSLCSGVKGGWVTLYPVLSSFQLNSCNGRHNLTKSRLVSRHREQNHHSSVNTFCKTTAF